MWRLKPILELNASPQITQLYQSIKNGLDVETVPLFFQYVANFELYLSFLWQRIEKNITVESFHESSRRIASFAREAVVSLHDTPSASLTSFVSSLHTREQTEILKTVYQLEKLNSILLLLTLDIREGMKSLFIQTQRLVQHTDEQTSEYFSNDFRLTHTYEEKNELTAPTTLLAPLFGANALIVSQYPEFFGKTSLEMQMLQKTESYLQKRVALEQQSLRELSAFVQPLGCSYKEFMVLTNGKPYISELLYILTDAFPSQFPHLVLTSAVMQKALSPVARATG